MGKPEIDAAAFLADFDALAKIGRQPDGAVHRVAYSAADQEGRAWVADRLRSLGLSPVDDAIGNTIAVYPGTADLPPIGVGSHTDTVPYGGAYDGALGVVAALAAIDALQKAEVRLQHPLEVINFAAEESTMSGGTTGSQAMTGLLDLSFVDKAAWDGRPVRDHLQAAGLDPTRLHEAKREPGVLSAFIELHIEQSAKLERTQTDIAVVDAYVGLNRYAANFAGTANHAGTTPMDERDDALLKATPLVQVVRDVALELGIVGTVGDFKVYPGAPNVIPGQVDIIIELRSADSDRIDQAAALLAEHTAELGGTFRPIVAKPPVVTDAQIQRASVDACHALGLSYTEMTSAAGHDAKTMATICPQGMLFIPSRNGISHAKEEYSTPEQCLNGAKVLLETVLKLDARLQSTAG